MFEIKFICLYLTLLLYNFDLISSKYVTRETVYGKIRGFVSNRALNISVEQYLGIPYASPPVGNLRFENPKVQNAWENILDALTIPPACPQMGTHYINYHVPGFNKTSEDCLYLNVYVPQITINESFPVLLYVHGGGNIWGMGAMFDGDVFAANGRIIIVTFNYRLGFLGFAAAEDRGLEGAYGLMDQVMAMEWVKTNIHFFGGDPEKVTIHGHSAGAIDVGLHLVSPLSKGLFRQAIIHSQSPLSIIALIKPEWKHGYNIIDIDKICPEKENKPLKLCLQSLPLFELVSRYGKKPLLMAFEFPVTVDKKFLTMRPKHLFEAGNFSGQSFLFSFTNAEWVHAVYRPWQDDQYPIPVKSIVEDGLNQIVTAFQENCLLKDVIRKEYNLTNDDDELASVRQLGQVESDFIFVEPMIRMANILAKWTDEVYVTRFDQPIYWDDLPIELGTAHGSDLFYIFGTPFIGHKNFNFTEKDRQISNKMMTLYSNFVKYGVLTLDRTTQYKKYSSDSKIVNNIKFDNNGLVVEEMYHYDEEKMKFWNEYLPKISKENVSSTCKSGSSAMYSKYTMEIVIVIFLYLHPYMYGLFLK